MPTELQPDRFAAISHDLKRLRQRIFDRVAQCRYDTGLENHEHVTMEILEELEMIMREHGILTDEESFM